MSTYFRNLIKPFMDWAMRLAKKDSDFSYADYDEMRKTYDRMYGDKR